LQELAASSLGGMPSYSIEEEGPDHAKRFTATVSVAGKSFGTGQGRSKKEAEQNAAQEAFETLAASQIVSGSGSGSGNGKAGTGKAGAVSADKPAGHK
jgi:ribonuclease-3